MGIRAMAEGAVGAVDLTAFSHLFRREGVAGRVGRRKHWLGRLGQCTLAAQLEHQQTAIAGIARIVKGGGQREGAAIADHDRHILLALHAVAHGRRDDAGLRLEVPQLGACAGVERLEIAGAVALEHQIARRRQGTAIPRAIIGDFPRRLLRHRIPGDQLALQRCLDRLELGPIIGNRTRIDGDAQVPGAFAAFKAFLILIELRHFLRRQIDQTSARAIAHRVPVVGAQRRRHHQRTGLAIARFRHFDRAAGLHVNAGGPGLRGKTLGRN